jgi:hypothetical protein
MEVQRGNAKKPTRPTKPMTQPTQPMPQPTQVTNDSFIRAIAAGSQPNPLSGAKMGGISMKKGGSVGSASKRADGIATKGKTRGKIC